MNQNNAAQPVLTDDEIIALDVEAGGTFTQGPVPFGRAIESALLSKLRAAVADERAAGLFREALAWGYVYGPKLNKNQWERMRDETAQQFSQRLAALASPPVDDGELRTAFNEWIDKTDFVQQRIASGALPAKYLGWHRADVMRDLIDAALASAPVAGEAVASMVSAKPLEPEFAKVLADNFYSLVLGSDAAPQASEAVREAALEEAAQALDRLHEENRQWHNEFRDAAAVVRALKPRAALSAQPGAQKTGGSE